jgi:2'-5' RNA ligase
MDLIPRHGIGTNQEQKVQGDDMLMYRPIVMCRPPDAIAPAIVGHQRSYGWACRPVREDMLHCTALPFALLPCVTTRLLDRIARALQEMDPEVFGLTFDRIGSFERWAGLSGSGAGVRGAATLRRKLTRAMHAAGLGQLVVKSSSRPHMTLLHNAPPIRSRPIDPIGWTVAELLLVVSHHGATFHEEIARWRLAPPRQGELFPLDQGVVPGPVGLHLDRLRRKPAPRDTRR